MLLSIPASLQAQFSYITNNGAITITGYTGTDGVVAIPDTINGLPVAAIGESAFYWRSGLTEISIPATVTNIGGWAFVDCWSLQSITVASENPAYASLDGVLFNKNLTTLIQAPAALAGGTYTIPSSTTIVGDNAFSYCRGLTNIVIPYGVTRFGYQAFDNCDSLASLLIPDSVTSISNTAFGNTALTSITIPNSVTNLGHGAFIYCNRLTNVTLSTNITSLGNSLFTACPLSSLTIPNSVVTIESRTFEQCSFSNVTIPESVTSIGPGSFSWCANLKSVTLGQGVTNIMERAFSACSALDGVYFTGNAPTFGANLFQWANNATVYFLPGTTNWGTTFADRPAMLWNPQIQTTAADFGIRTNRYGFTVAGTPAIPIVIEAATDLSSPTWLPLNSLNLTNGSYYFADPEWTNFPTRFYRIRSP